MVDNTRRLMRDYYGVELKLLVEAGLIDVERIIGDETRRAGNSILVNRVNECVFPQGAYVKMLYTDENDSSPPSIYDDLPLFRREIKLSHRFNGTVSPRILHTEKINGRYGVLTLLCQENYDGTLEDLRYSSRKLDTLGIDLADKLSVVHFDNIMHRDVKPANILFRKRRVKKWHTIKTLEFSLTDFGISKDCNTILCDTLKDELDGTPIYISPEVAFGQVKDYSDLEKSEIFSFGLTLAVYAMRESEEDFANKLPAELYQMYSFYKKDHHRKILQTSMRRMSKQSRELIMACTDPKPYNRPQSFAKIVTALR
jgi:serine/threonine protein kinase